jgi:rod shape-determining protein MreC
LNFFNFDFKKAILIVLVISLPLISINNQQSPYEGSWLSKPFSLLGAFAQNVFYTFSEGVRSNTSLYVNLINIKKENSLLKSKNNELSTRLTKFEEISKENDRLNQLMDFKQNSKMQLIAARVMGRDLMSDHHTIHINKGTQHGLKSGQAVITTEGVVGYLFRPELMSSYVLLITDRYAVIDGIIQRTRARGIIEGKNQTKCQMKYIERSEDVKEGDIVVTSGLDNIFPKGFPVAKVDYVELKAYSVSLKVDLHPIVDTNKVEEVFIITNAAHEDLMTQTTPETPLVPEKASLERKPN